MFQKNEHMKLYKRSMLPIVIIVVILSFVSEAKAFIYAEIKSGDTYDTVKNFLIQRERKVIDFNENLITTESGEILTDFIFVNKRFCETRVKHSQRKFGSILADIDYIVRGYGTPINMEPKGKSWGDGFTIKWKQNNQVVNYDVGYIPIILGKPQVVVRENYIDLNYCN